MVLFSSVDLTKHISEVGAHVLQAYSYYVANGKCIEAYNSVADLELGAFYSGFEVVRIEQGTLAFHFRCLDKIVKLEVTPESLDTIPAEMKELGNVLPLNLRMTDGCLIC